MDIQVTDENTVVIQMPVTFEITAEQDKLANLQSNLATLQSDLLTQQNDLAKTQAAIDDTQTKIDAQQTFLDQITPAVKTFVQNKITPVDTTSQTIIP
jgi:peptidoglycan hydrolase CwlO-like protein